MLSFWHFRNRALSHVGSREEIMSILDRKRQNLLSVWSGKKNTINAGAESHWWEWLILMWSTGSVLKVDHLVRVWQKFRTPILWYIISVDPTYLCKTTFNPTMKCQTPQNLQHQLVFWKSQQGCGLALRLKFWSTTRKPAVTSLVDSLKTSAEQRKCALEKFILDRPLFWVSFMEDCLGWGLNDANRKNRLAFGVLGGLSMSDAI